MTGLAGWETRGELSRLWQICFGESRRAANFFFNNAFHPENCLVYRVKDRVAAMLHLLPARLAVLGGGTVPAHYVFACATLPEYRTRGFMNTLLAYAALAGMDRGDQFSVLLPAERRLYAYYEKSEYQAFFSMEERELTRFQLSQIASDARPSRFVCSAAGANQIRTALLRNRPGSLLWDDKRVWFALAASKGYGGRIVSIENAYAVCRMETPDQCCISEWMAYPGAQQSLAAAVLRDMPADSYRIRFPEGAAFPAGSPEKRAYGMIKPIGGTSINALAARAPYLGLAMD